ncbi:hypothetical protein BH24ACT13_BH24ACT13_14280 [soil metagenome]
MLPFDHLIPQTLDRLDFVTNPGAAREAHSVGVHEAKTHLSRLLARVSVGEEIEITNRGRVVARLVGPRHGAPNLGFDRGRVQVADDFDAPLPDDLQAAFEG